MIKNIIFDFGRVLMPITESKSWKAFEALGAKRALKEKTDIFDQYETGELSTQEFLQQIQPYFFRKIFLADIGEAWNAMIDTKIPEENIRLLKRTKTKYRIFLLSNINDLHLEAIKTLSGPFLLNQLNNQFEKVSYSHKIGQRKPDKETFETILAENELKAEETLYIDDSHGHIESAKTLAIKTWLFNPELDKITDLDKVLSELHS